MARKRKKIDGQSVKTVARLIGKYFYLCDEDSYYSNTTNNMAFKVKVKDVVQDGCNIQALIEPADGLGESSTCLTNLLTEEQFYEKLENEERNARATQLKQGILRHHYLKERRAAFHNFVEEHIPNEIPALLEEYADFSKISDYAIKQETERLVNKHLGIE